VAAFTQSGLLAKVIAGSHLSSEEAHWAFGRIMAGEWTEAQIAALLAALAAKGECVEEFTGAAMAMRDHVVPVEVGNVPVVDTCGTGGTGISTFNISTTAALVAAGAGAKVAKHGNRTNTRASGSANVLAALGVNIDCDAAAEARCLVEAGVCFSFAVRHHPAMKYAVPVRKQLGVRTIFNVLGPLTNPAGARRQLMGVPSDELTEILAGVLAALGAHKAMVVHSADGLDEISTTAVARVSELSGGKVRTYTLDAPHLLGLARARLADLLVDSPEASAAVVRDVLAGKKGPARDIVLVNAAAALMVADLAADLAAGAILAARSIDTGKAAAALESLVRISNGTL
jgi:anthranilate phosphoribosyltransferase